MARFVLYQGISRYDALTVFVDELALGLQDAGHEVLRVDLARAGLEATLQDALSQRPKAAIGFNCVGAEASQGGSLLHAQKAMPYVGILVDHPIYHVSRLRTALPRYLVTCIDHSHVDFTRAQFPNVQATFLAHGACDPGPAEPAPRDMDLVVGGSYEDPDEVAAGWRTGAGQAAAIFDEIAERTLQAPLTPLGVHTAAAFEARDLPMDVLEQEALYALLTLVDRHVRSLWRARCLLALEAAGLQADVYGQGWSTFRHPTRHRFRGAIPFSELNQVLKRAKVVVAVGANFPNGSHERVLTAMRCGAATVTDENPYFASSFTADRDLALYSLARLEGAAEKAAALLADGERREAMGQAGRSAVLSAHTWKQRARELLAVIDAQGW